MNQTDNYQLCQWDAEDRILRADFNSDNQKTDAAIAANAASIAEHAVTLATRGNARIWTTSYVGDEGENGPPNCTFPEKPLFFLVFGGRAFALISDSAEATVCYGTSTNRLTVTWSGKTASWSAASSTLALNDEMTYRVVAFLPPLD